MLCELCVWLFVFPRDWPVVFTARWLPTITIPLTSEVSVAQGRGLTPPPHADTTALWAKFHSTMEWGYSSVVEHLTAFYNGMNMGQTCLPSPLDFFFLFLQRKTSVWAFEVSNLLLNPEIMQKSDFLPYNYFWFRNHCRKSPTSWANSHSSWKIKTTTISFLEYFSDVGNNHDFTSTLSTLRQGHLSGSVG